MAQQIDGQLLFDKFDWADWLDGKVAPRTITEWVAAFEAEYFQRRARNIRTQATWDNSYQHHFNRLPLESNLSVECLKKILLTYKPTTRSRLGCSVAFAALARFAGIDSRELLELGRGYRPPPKKRVAIPSDEQIILQIEQIPSLPWRNAAALQATFGLRNHEVFKCDLERVEEGIVRVWSDTKTGERTVFACPPDWVGRFGLAPKMPLPAITIEGRGNRRIGQALWQGYKRLGLPNPYAYRDAYAVRLEFYWEGATPVAFKARWMGHAPSVHDKNYLDAIQEEHHERMFSKLRGATKKD